MQHSQALSAQLGVAQITVVNRLWKTEKEWKKQLVPIHSVGVSKQISADTCFILYKRHFYMGDDRLTPKRRPEWLDIISSWMPRNNMHF